jgi:hypothetical protein
VIYNIFQILCTCPVSYTIITVYLRHYKHLFAMDSTTTKGLLISLAVIVAVFVGAFFAYQSGILDPVIEKIGIYLFKAKAMAEKKKLQAQGMKAGEDFMDCE